MGLGVGQAEESPSGFSFGWSFVWVSSCSACSPLPIASLACEVSVSCPWGSSAGELLLAEPFWPFLYPVFFLLAYGVAKGNAGFETTLQDWVLALPVVYREFLADERHLPYKSV